MKLRRLAGIFALVLTLLAGQQAAFAHFVGHLAGTEATAVREDPDHGMQESLARVCVACAAFIGLDGAAPPAFPVFWTGSFSVCPPLSPTTPGMARASAGNYRSRAPPSA